MRNPDERAAGTLIDILGERAVEQPDRLAYSFLADGETQGSSFTHSEIDTRARAIGSWLRSVTQLGDRVLLLLPSGSEFVAAFFGCLYGGVVAVPAYPLDPERLERTAVRLRGMIIDAAPAVGLTGSFSLGSIGKLAKNHPELSSVRWTDISSISPEHAGTWKCPPVNAETLAILQYTSGSTATPKGVMISHRNVLENERMIQRAHDHSEENTFVGWIPLAHDWGLINNVLQPLYSCALSVLMPPEAFLRNPVLWLQAISRFPNVTSGGPCFAYELCVAKIKSEQREGLHLENWDCAGIGASPVHPETLDRFVAAFSGCGFRRQSFYCGYGLAEATLLVSDSNRFAEPRVMRLRKAALERNDVAICPDDDFHAVSVMGCGKAPVGERIAIVDPHSGCLSAPGKVGEIWVSGGNVAQGYWNNAAETHATFNAFLNDSGEGPFLRTGDLGFLNQDELFVTGRLKDLIIIRGRNIYPEDIELTVERCDKLLRSGCTAAFSIEGEFEEKLVIVQEVRESDSSSLLAIIETIRRTVSREHELTADAILLVKERSIPKTSSGKLRRQACKTAYLGGDLPVVQQGVLTGEARSRPSLSPFLPPGTPVEQKLATIWSRILKVEQIGIHDRFFDLGGDSLAAAQCLAGIQSDFELEQFTSDIFLYAPTLREMAEAISNPASFLDRMNEAQAIQPQGRGIPLVLVFPGTEYHSLARRLGPDRRVLGISPARIDRLPLPCSVEQIASECLVRLRRYYPGGPYSLAGWCASGIVALEMARQLVEEGEEVAFVALLDSSDIFLPPTNRRLWIRCWRFAQRIRFFASKLHRRGWTVMWQRAAVLRRQVHQATSRIVGAPGRRNDVLIEALRSFQPRPWPGRTIQVWPEERPKGAFRSLEFLWSGISTGGFVFHEVPGDHLSMLHEPNVAALAAILAAELDGAQVARTRSKLTAHVS